MTTDTPVWYLPGSDGKPAGPFTATQVIDGIRFGRINQQTLCWREGTPQWLPLGQVTPFASAFCSNEQVTATVPRRHAARWIGRIIALACILGLIYVGYVVVSETMAIRKATELLADQEFDEASSIAEPLTESYLQGDEASYLVAVADIKAYAAAEDAPRESQLHKAERRLKKLLAGDEARHGRATADLDRTWLLLPPEADQPAARVLALTRCHEKLALAATEDLAGALLLTLQQRGLPDDRDKLASEIIPQLLAWDPNLSRDVVALLLPTDDSRQQLTATLFGMNRWVQQDASLAAPLAAGLISHAQSCQASNDLDRADQLLASAATLNPEARPEILGHRLNIAKARILANQPHALMALQGLIIQAPELKTEAAAICAAAAESLRLANLPRAQQALQAVTWYDPKYLASEEGRFLQLRVSSPGNLTQIQQCQTFLADYPNSEHRIEVLNRTVSSAVALVKGSGRRGWGSVDPTPALTAARDAGHELVRQHADTRDLDKRLLDLCQCLASQSRHEDAYQLASRLIEGLPRTSLRQDIEAATSQWAATLNGPLPPELQVQAAQVLKRLKIVTVESAAHLRELDRLAPRVARVANDCLAAQLSSADIQRLQTWVRKGGILWCSNDLLSTFGIEGDWYRGAYSGLGGAGMGMGGNERCRVVFSSEDCALSAGCKDVEVQATARNLQHATAIPLLKSGSSWCWSLIRYGDGWISNVPKVDLAQCDGARFWLNFRLFCLGDPIPGAAFAELDVKKLQEIATRSASEPAAGSGYPGSGYGEGEMSGGIGTGWATTAPDSSAPAPTVIATIEELNAALDNLQDQNVMWIQLTASEVDVESVQRIVQWVKQGGVLWVDTDLARDPGPAAAIGFRLKDAAVDQVRGKVNTNPSLMDHQALAGLPSEVEYVLSDSQLLLAVRLDKNGNPLQQLEILMAWVPDKLQRVMTALCATKKVGQGLVIYRPRAILPEPCGRQFEHNLRQYSSGYVR